MFGLSTFGANFRYCDLSDTQTRNGARQFNTAHSKQSHHIADGSEDVRLASKSKKVIQVSSISSDTT